MKTVIYLLGGILCFSYLELSPKPAQAQYMLNPKKHFKKFKFDMEVRGAYNITDCVSNTINCWEAVKPDFICSSLQPYGTVCDVLSEYCHNLIGDQTGYWYSMQVQEMWCNDWEAFTK